MDISQMHITEQGSVEGNGSIEINDISSGSLSSLTIGGGCSRMPPGYKQLGAVGNIANSSKINLALYPHDGDVIEVKFRSNSGSFYLLQARQGTSGTIYGLGGAQSGSTLSGYFCGTTLTSEITRETGHDYIVRLSAVDGTLTLYVEDLTAGTNDTKTGTYTWSTYNTSYYLWGNASNTYAYRCGIYYAKITNGTSTRMYYVPVDYNGNKGFYDFVSKSFKTKTAGQALTTYITPADTSIIVPNVNLPIDITCNNGVIKYRNKSGLPSGYLKLNYIQGGNGSYIDTGIIPSCDVLHVKWKGQLLGSQYGGSFMGCSAGTTPRYGFRIFSNANNGQIVLQSKNSLVGVDGGFDISTVDVTYNNTNGNITGTINSDSVTQTGADIDITLNKNMLLFSAYIGDNVGTAGENKCWYLQIEKDGVIVADLIPAKRASDSALGMYDLVSDTFLENQGTGSFTGGNIDYTDAEYYCDGTPETITDELGNTVNVENLLQVKNNTFEGIDTQDILSGIIHRNIGVKILRSSDVTDYQSTNSRFVLSAGSKQNLGTRVTPLFCTHFRTIDDGTALANVPNMSIYGASTTSNLYIHYTSYTTKSSFGNWLESQYTNGTPVIVVYPLDVPTTETVSPQSLSLIGGDNTIARSNNNILNLPISGEYIGVLQREEYSVLRGPCPYGFHIPNRDELDIINNYLYGVGTTPAYGRRTLLLVPYAGYIDTNGNLQESGEAIYLYGNINKHLHNNRYEYHPYFFTAWYNGSSSVTYETDISKGYNIRPIKDTYVAPDSSWTLLDGPIGSSEYTYWNSSLGLISIPDIGITVADKNLGATVAYNYGDTFSEANCGKFYQRGNNYGFPFTGPTITNTAKVNTTGYGPLNPYYSNVFITGSGDRSSPTNTNLRGYESYVNQVDDIYVGDGDYDHLELYVGDNRDKSLTQGPCPDGYHIPTRDEISLLLNCIPYTSALNYLFLRRSGILLLGANSILYSTDTTQEYIRTSTQSSNDQTKSYCFMGGSLNNLYERSKIVGMPIRPFKDEFAQPDNTRDEKINLGEYHLWTNDTLGLVSIKRDGYGELTIADKNIGASSSSDIGYYFERGNNHGFVVGDAPTVISTIDTTGYGPGNYYDNNTFSSSNGGDRSSPTNPNLRGYESYVNSIEPNIAEAFVGDRLIWVNYKPITPEAGLYRCPTKGLMSISSDGINRITFADRNLGAINPGDVGSFYQWGNNYGFKNPISSSSTNDVNISGYGPDNYYYSSTFIKSASGEWWTNASRSYAFDLWGGVTFTDEAARGPCGVGRHVPSSGDWTYVINRFNAIASDPELLWSTLKLGKGDRLNNSTGNKECCVYHTRCCNVANVSGVPQPYYMADYDNANPLVTYGNYASYGYPIRPFRNTPVIPDDTSWIKII